MPGSPTHLVSRFLDVLTSSPLEAVERENVEKWLQPELATIFFSQSVADQRHGYHSGSLVAVQPGIASEVVVAALLHDVGKRHAQLGIIGRSLASILILMRLPLTERMRRYREHGALAARELGRLRAPSLAIDFALHHHGRRPATIELATWELLVAADRPRKASAMLGGRITSTDT